ncbi:MAG: MFS transporter [Oligoflexales bacterium]
MAKGKHVEKDKIQLRALMNALLGTVVEYFDYGLYGFSAFVLKDAFFPKSNPEQGLMYTFIVLMMGYLVKPLGSIYFGSLGDRCGRRKSLTLTILGMCIPTFFIGCLPTYASVGVFATASIVVCRLLQGFFAGGEYDGAALYVLEHVPESRRGFGASLTRAAAVMGLFFGSVTVSFFGLEVFPTWAWRIPFLLSLPLALLVFWLRSSMGETPEFERMKNKGVQHQPYVQVLRDHFKNIALVSLTCGAIGGSYQFTFIFLKSYFQLIDFPMSGSLFSTALFVFACSMILSGVAADHFGFKRVVVFGVCNILFGVIFLIQGLSSFQESIVFLGLVGLAVTIAPLSSLMHAVIYSHFPVEARYRAVGLGHTLGSTILSGATPMLSTYLYTVSGNMMLPFLFLICLVLTGGGLLSFFLVKKSA